jgi:membrane associated rhomboid family serine protease
MLPRRGENHHSIYVLLFLTIAFFLMQRLDPMRFMTTFALDRGAVLSGQWWRLLTYQFMYNGNGAMGTFWFLFALQFLWITGSTLEEEWGTFHFVVSFLLTCLGGAAVGMFIGLPLLGSFFTFYTILFCYATVHPHERFMLFFIIPVPARILAILAAVMLAIGVVTRQYDSVAALAGVILGYGYFLVHLRLPARANRMARVIARAQETAADQSMRVAQKNRLRFTAMKVALASGRSNEIDRLIVESDRDMTPGVNICPPADYKPETQDGYCLRCDGFAECSARYLRANRPEGTTPVTLTEANEPSGT